MGRHGAAESKPRRRHGRIPRGKLFVKGCRISFQNSFTSSFNLISVIRVVVAVLALATRSTRRGGSKALAIELETTVECVQSTRRQEVRKTSVQMHRT